MYIHKTAKSHKGKTYTNYLLVESVSTPKGPRQRIICSRWRGVDPALYPQNFSYHPTTNTYTCPAQKVLPYRTTKHDRVGVERHV